MVIMLYKWGFYLFLGDTYIKGDDNVSRWNNYFLKFDELKKINYYLCVI